MGRKIIAGILCVSLLTVAPLEAFAAEKESSNQVSTQGPRKHLTTIVFAGLAGAILGLSTLSFYGRPQDKLSNIAVGFAVGIISGTIYTTYKAAAEPRDFYSTRDAQSELWAAMDAGRFQPRSDYAPKANFVFEF